MRNVIWTQQDAVLLLKFCIHFNRNWSKIARMLGKEERAIVNKYQRIRRNPEELRLLTYVRLQHDPLPHIDIREIHNFKNNRGRPKRMSGSDRSQSSFKQEELPLQMSGYMKRGRGRPRKIEQLQRRVQELQYRQKLNPSVYKHMNPRNSLYYQEPELPYYQDRGYMQNKYVLVPPQNKKYHFSNEEQFDEKYKLKQLQYEEAKKNYNIKSSRNEYDPNPMAWQNRHDEILLRQCMNTPGQWNVISDKMANVFSASECRARYKYLSKYFKEEDLLGEGEDQKDQNTDNPKEKNNGNNRKNSDNTIEAFQKEQRKKMEQQLEEQNAQLIESIGEQSNHQNHNLYSMVNKLMQTMQIELTSICKVSFTAEQQVQQKSEQQQHKVKAQDFEARSNNYA